jgi:hypothetical protein
MIICGDVLEARPAPDGWLQEEWSSGAEIAFSAGREIYV